MESDMDSAMDTCPVALLRRCLRPIMVRGGVAVVIDRGLMFFDRQSSGFLLLGLLPPPDPLFGLNAACAPPPSRRLSYSPNRAEPCENAWSA